VTIEGDAVIITNAFSTERLDLADVRQGQVHPYRSVGVTYTVLTTPSSDGSHRVLAVPPAEAEAFISGLAARQPE
jgi:hypothetical protein